MPKDPDGSQRENDTRLDVCRAGERHGATAPELHKALGQRKQAPYFPCFLNISTLTDIFDTLIRIIS